MTRTVFWFQEVLEGERGSGGSGGSVSAEEASDNEYQVRDAAGCLPSRRGLAGLRTLWCFRLQDARPYNPINPASPGPVDPASDFDASDFDSDYSDSDDSDYWYRPGIGYIYVG